MANYVSNLHYLLAMYLILIYGMHIIEYNAIKTYIKYDNCIP